MKQNGLHIGLYVPHNPSPYAVVDWFFKSLHKAKKAEKLFEVQHTNVQDKKETADNLF